MDLKLWVKGFLIGLFMFWCFNVLAYLVCIRDEIVEIKDILKAVEFVESSSGSYMESSQVIA